MEAMRKLNDASQDSRLNAFTRLIEDDLARHSSSLRICVAASSRAALYYLSSQLEYLGIQHHLLHSAMSPADQADSLASFLDEGGVLLATFPVLKGIALPTVTDLVLYDLPGSRTVAAVVIGVFDCVGRTKRLRIHLLAPADEPPGTDALSSVRSALIHGDPSAR
jgi:superfamily II DNA/RNA helicase